VLLLLLLLVEPAPERAPTRRQNSSTAVTHGCGCLLLSRGGLCVLVCRSIDRSIDDRVRVHACRIIVDRASACATARTDAMIENSIQGSQSASQAHQPPSARRPPCSMTLSVYGCMAVRMTTGGVHTQGGGHMQHPKAHHHHG
jgi:hypothetical protein